MRTQRLLPLLFTLVATACGGAPAPAPVSTAAPTATAPPASMPASAASPAATVERVEADGLRITDTTVGQGREVKSGDKIVVHYTGKLEDGYVFDSSRGPSRKPFEVIIGVGKVIKGWDRGIVGMREGGTRHLVIPPALGYGDANTGKIPPRSTLAFDVELLEVKP